ncbi:MAG: class I SAM-dependent methyltransferase [Prevotella sp.]|nr:class I SAM-dependent methyltransferase [Prevotella sp.]
MQERHKNRTHYFHELARTSRKYFMPYIAQFKHLGHCCRILEIGCGDGGNLLPFAQMGCYTLGVDIDEGRISGARKLFASCDAKGDFIASDVFLLEELHGALVSSQPPFSAKTKSEFSVFGLIETFDIIICHDVIEHICDKRRLLSKLHQFLTKDGIIFMSFPAWQMPFGGHQQICRSRVVSHMPFVHLLPKSIYRLLLKAFGESDACIGELMSIKETRTSVETFERILKDSGTFTVKDRTLWLVNPHYETKFGMRPRRQWAIFSHIQHLRNLYTTSAWYLLQ